MLKKFLLGAAMAVAASTASHAAINVDGVVDGSYGAPKAHVTHDAGAPDSNFGAPTGITLGPSYDIYLSSDAGFVYGILVAGSDAGAAGPFANLYWDINPDTGSDIGFELGATSQNVFRPGGANLGAVGDIVVSLSGDSKRLEFAIPNHYFLTPPAGLSLSSGILPSLGDTIRLNLSQSFHYSVAGGATTYGTERLGTVVLGGVVPEPATWAMMLMGFMAMGAMIRSRRSAPVRA